MDFNRRFEKLLSIIFDSNLNNKLINKNVLELFFLLFIALLPLLKSPDKCKTAFSGRKAATIDFDVFRRLFLPNTLLLIPLSKISSKLFL